MPKTTILIADTALETIPKEIQNNNLIRNYAKKKNKLSSEVLLDSSYHHSVMHSLKNSKKRGRPDILHICLLNILGSPLVKENPQTIRILIHTINNELIQINPITRIPKNYNRFIGLIEKLFKIGKIENNDLVLLEFLNNINLEDLLKDIPRAKRLLFCSKGKKTKLSQFFIENAKNDVLMIIGGFPHGDFSKEIENLSDNRISIYEKSLEAWIVLSRILYLRENSLK